MAARRRERRWPFTCFSLPKCDQEGPYETPAALVIFCGTACATESTLVYRTILGFNWPSWTSAVAADASGCAYVAGVGFSNPGLQFPAGSSASSFQLVKLDPKGGGPVWSRVIPEASGVYAMTVEFEIERIATDPDRSAVIYALHYGSISRSRDGGQTWEFIGAGVSLGVLAVQPGSGRLHAGGSVPIAPFVVRFTPSGDDLLFSTYLGGPGGEASSVALDGDGSAFIADSRRLLFRLSAHGNSFDLETLPEGASPIASDGRGAVYRAVWGNDPIHGPVLEKLGPAPPGFSIAGNGIGNADVPFGPLLGSPVIAPGMIVRIYGTDFAAETKWATGSLPLPTQILDSSVTFNGTPGALWLVSPNEVIAVVPNELDLETAVVEVKRRSTRADRIQVSVAAAAPYFFGKRTLFGYEVAALHSNTEAVNARYPATADEIITVFCAGLGKLRANGESEIPVQLFLVEWGTRYELEVLYAGAAPGWPGENQINFRMKPGSNTGWLERLELGTAGRSIWGGIYVR